MVKIYDGDKLTEVTQEWCDTAQKQLNSLALQREAIRKIANLNTADVDNVNTIRSVLNLIPDNKKEI